jgi:cytoskeletal protein CcmA (bactofilin family)
MKEMNENLDTIIGKATKVVGEIHSDGSLRIDGKIDGAVDVKGFLTIGPTANVKAEVRANEAIVSGIVNGNIIVEEKLELEKTARIKGDIITKVLTVNTGARFNGKCQMGTEEEKKINASKKDIPKEPKIL